MGGVFKMAYEANRKFNDPEQLKNDIEEFFIQCKEENRVPTITGLAVHLDTTRLTLLDYENEIVKKLPEHIKHEISNTIKKDKQRVQAEYEQALFDRGKTTGAIFTLKNNFNWADKQEIVQTTNNKADLSGLTTEQIQELLKEDK